MSQVILFVALSLIQTISGQYINTPYNAGFNGNALAAESALANGFGYGGLPNPLVNQLANPLANPLANTIPNTGYDHVYPGAFTPSASSGSAFTVRSSSPIAPNGVSVQSENLVIEGPVAVSGQLPFLGVVALEGPLPTVGEGTIAYGCGNGNVGITNEAEIGPMATGMLNPGMPAPGMLNPGMGVGPNLQRPLY